MVGRPSYRREDLTAGIVHFGVGNFHRAHLGSYLDRMFSAGLGRDWAVVGAGVMPDDNRVRAALRRQEYLSLLVTHTTTASEARVLAPMIDFLPVGDGEVILGRLVDPAIRIVSLTITEGGYFLDADGRFDSSHGAIREDAERHEKPKTVFGLMIGALRARRDAGIAPFTVLSCDNLPHNGDCARAATVGLARLTDADFAEWVDRHVAFPNSMVDRITPSTSDRERHLVWQDYGVQDEVPVVSEAFTQWVLEDGFPGGRPPLEEVGVQFVEDVAPYEELKLRILNASHAMIAYPAALLGLEYAHEAMADRGIAAMLEKVQRRDVLPIVRAMPGMEPSGYFDRVRERFANPRIADTIVRLCYDGSSRQPKFIVPSLRDAVARGSSLDGLALAAALWCRYCAGEHDDGAAIVPNDPNWDQLNAAARAARTVPSIWLAQRDIYGDIGNDRRFLETFASWHDRLHTLKTRATLNFYLDSGDGR